MTKINMTKLALLGATALLASTSAHAQVADTWSIGGDVNVSALNQADTTTLDFATDGINIDGANIGGGYKNSISGAAVGASASSSFNFYNGSTVTSGATAEITGNLTVVAGNGAAVLNSTDITTGANIGGGNGNSISVAAVGSSASGSATASVTGGTAVDVDVNYTVGDVTIQSGDGADAADATDATVGGNTGTVQLLLATGIATPDIAGGNANSISAAGVGSSASFSLAYNAQGASSIATSAFTVGALNVLSTNAEGADVTVGADGASALVDTALIEGGNANSISVAAVGSSASASVSDTSYSEGTGPAAATITIGDIAVNSTNGAAITNQTDLTSAPTIATGSNNSISVAGVGSSASLAMSVTDYSGAGVTLAATGTGAASIASVNTGIVTVNTGMDTPTITEGFNNSISAAAVGASASQSFSHTNLPAN